MKNFIILIVSTCLFACGGGSGGNNNDENNGFVINKYLEDPDSNQSTIPDYNGSFTINMANTPQACVDSSPRSVSVQGSINNRVLNLAFPVPETKPFDTYNCSNISITPPDLEVAIYYDDDFTSGNSTSITFRHNTDKCELWYANIDGVLDGSNGRYDNMQLTQGWNFMCKTSTNQYIRVAESDVTIYGKYGGGF